MRGFWRRGSFIVALFGLLLLPASVQGKSASRTNESLAEAAVSSDFQVSSSLTLRYISKKRVIYGFVEISGTGTSPDEDECMNDRKVSLLRVTKLNGRSRERVVATNRSEYDGYFGWKFNSQDAARGWWAVKVEKRTFSDRYGELIECAGARLARDIKI